MHETQSQDIIASSRMYLRSQLDRVVYKITPVMTNQDTLTLRGRTREELVSKTSQFKESPASSVTDL